MAEMKLLLREIYQRFQTVPHSCMTEESMRAHDQIISARPYGQRCLLHFVPNSTKEGEFAKNTSDVV